MSLPRLLLAVVVHSLAIYLFLIVAFGVLGRRLMAQLTLLDYLVIALLGSAVETGLYLGGGSFWAGLTSAATLLVANRAAGVVVKHVPAARRLLVGVPILLVHDGRVIEAHLERAHVTRENLLTAVRRRGYDNIEMVRFAVMEPGGDISVVPRKDTKEASDA